MRELIERLQVTDEAFATSKPTSMRTGPTGSSVYSEFSAAVKTLDGLATRLDNEVEALLDQWAASPKGSGSFVTGKMLHSVIKGHADRLKRITSTVQSAAKKAKKKVGGK